MFESSEGVTFYLVKTWWFGKKKHNFQPKKIVRAVVFDISFLFYAYSTYMKIYVQFQIYKGAPNPAVVCHIKVAHPHFCWPEGQMSAAKFYLFFKSFTKTIFGKILCKHHQHFKRTEYCKTLKANCWSPVGVEDLELVKLWSIDAN